MPYDLASYEQTGVATPIRVLDEAKAIALGERVMAISGADNEDVALALQTSPHFLFPWLYDLATLPSVLDAVEHILGPDILIWSSQFFTKQPGDGGFVSWHQDSTYWGLEPNTITTAWIALTPSTPISGCMQVAPGTQTKKYPHSDTFGDKNLLSRGQEITVDVSHMETLDIVLQPGEMSLHHVDLAHGSEPNTATWPRIGYVIRYIPTSVRQLGGRTRATLVRGQDRYNHFELTEAPDGELTEKGWENARDAKHRMATILMESATQSSNHASHRATK